MFVCFVSNLAVSPRATVKREEKNKSVHEMNISVKRDSDDFRFVPFICIATKRNACCCQKDSIKIMNDQQMYI